MSLRHFVLHGSSAAVLLLTSCGVVPPKGEALDAVALATSERLSIEPGWSSDEARSAIDSMLDDGQLTSEEAVRIALANNPRLQGILEELNVSRAEVWQAVLPPNPVLGAQYLWLRHDPARIVDLSATIDLVQLMLIPVKRQVAMSHYEEAKSRVAGAAIELAVETRRVYRELQVQLSLVDALSVTSTRRLDDRDASAAETATEENTADRQESVGEIESELLDHDQRVAVASATGIANAMRENLALLMGLQGGNVGFALEETLDAPTPLALDANTAEQVALDSNFELGAARSRVVALGQAMGLHRIEQRFPRGEAGVTANKGEHDGDNHDNDDEDDEWALGPSARFSLPIFDWGQAADEADHARIHREMQELTNLALHIRRAARANWILAMTAEANMRFAEHYVYPLARRVYEGDLDPGTRFRATYARVRTAALLREYWSARSNLEALMLGVIPKRSYSFSAMESGELGDGGLFR